MAVSSDEQFQAFERWVQRQDDMKVNGNWLMGNLLVWNEEYPEDERAVLEVDSTWEQLEKLLEVYAAQVRAETLQWVTDNLYTLLNEDLADDPPGVDMKAVREAMLEDHDWKEVEYDGTDED
jgi:hypothetical protein